MAFLAVGSASTVAPAKALERSPATASMAAVLDTSATFCAAWASIAATTASV